jgi:hypothetical protein
MILCWPGSRVWDRRSKDNASQLSHVFPPASDSRHFLRRATKIAQRPWKPCKELTRAGMLILSSPPSSFSPRHVQGPGASGSADEDVCFRYARRSSSLSLTRDIFLRRATKDEKGPSRREGIGTFLSGSRIAPLRVVVVVVRWVGLT